MNIKYSIESESLMVVILKHKNIRNLKEYYYS